MRTIRHNTLTEEWVVRIRINGKLVESYYTDDKADAIATAKLMVERHEKLIQTPRS